MPFVSFTVRRGLSALTNPVAQAARHSAHAHFPYVRILYRLELTES